MNASARGRAERPDERDRFCERSVAGARLVVARDYRDEIDALKLCRRGALDALLRASEARPGGRAGVWHVALPESGRTLHVRAFAHGGWLRGVTGSRLLRLARPLAELAVTDALHERGVAVPAPVFVAGERRGATWRAALATELERDARSGGDFLRAGPAPARLLEAVAAAAAAIRVLHDAGGVHADLHVDNLLVVARPGEPLRVVVTDLDRARIANRVEPRRRMAELMRLYRSLVKRGLEAGATPRVSATFLAAYTGGDRDLRGELLRHVSRERARLRRHALLYPRRPA